MLYGGYAQPSYPQPVYQYAPPPMPAQHPIVVAKGGNNIKSGMVMQNYPYQQNYAIKVEKKKSGLDPNLYNSWMNQLISLGRK